MAFYNGNKKEQTILLSTFKKLVNHIRNFIQFRFYMGLVDNIVAKCKLGMVDILLLQISSSLISIDTIHSPVSFSRFMDEKY